MQILKGWGACFTQGVFLHASPCRPRGWRRSAPRLAQDSTPEVHSVKQAFSTQLVRLSLWLHTAGRSMPQPRGNTHRRNRFTHNKSQLITVSDVPF